MIRQTFETSDYLDNVCDGLLVWKDISHFMHINRVFDPLDTDDEKEKKKKNYEKEMLKFDLDVKRLYQYGRMSYLTERNITGGSETCYFHVVRYYFPRVAKYNWDEYGLGLGVFSMQGIERRNKESKFIMNNYSNNKGNLVIPNLSRLWDMFEHGCRSLK